MYVHKCAAWFHMDENGRSTRMTLNLASRTADELLHVGVKAHIIDRPTMSTEATLQRRVLDAHRLVITQHNTNAGSSREETLLGGKSATARDYTVVKPERLCIVTHNYCIAARRGSGFYPFGRYSARPFRKRVSPVRDPLPRPTD